MRDTLLHARHCRRPLQSVYVCCIVVVLSCAVAIAGAIDPELQAKLASCDASQRTEVDVEIAGGISAADLTCELDSTCITLDQRRWHGVGLLMQTAARTQKSVLRLLRQWQAEGRAANIQSNWLTNTISVELIPADVTALAIQPDVIEIFQYARPRQIEADDSGPRDRSALSEPGVEENLKFIGADPAWRMGYTGEGRVLCLFDYTNVERDHPALEQNWKGNDGDSAAAYHPWPGARPRNDFYYHGTHLMGIMIGHDDATGDTIGVAPGATWIAADNAHFYWAANPDGDSSTTADMPDAINISFGTGYSCWDRYWNEIDMVEALGIVVVIAAGNGGSGAMTTGGPGNRAEDSLTNFAVGSVDHRTGDVWFSSSRGPSNCDSVSIKPNVTAPGVTIRSSVPGGLYDLHGGTSMAAPHVTAAVAILRQAAPNATTREIKKALLAGCTPRGGTHPNNDYGWGTIYIPRSLEWLIDQQRPDVRVATFNYEQVRTVDTLHATFTLHNRGHAADSIFVRFAEKYPGLRVLQDSIYIGPLARNGKTQSTFDIDVAFDDTLGAGAVVPFACEIGSAGGYLDTATLYVLAGIEGEPQFFTHANDKLRFSVSNFGQYGFAGESVRSYGLYGFRWGDLGRNCLWEAALAIAIDSNHVSDGWRNIYNHPDDDFWIDATQRLRFYFPGEFADQETYSVYDDGRAENRIGLRVAQHTMSWDNPPDDEYVIVEYEITNITDRTIPDILVGLELDWTYQFPNYDFSAGSGFSRKENLGFMFHRDSDVDSSRFRGVTVLNFEGLRSYRTIAQNFDGGHPHEGVTEYEKYAAMSEGLVDTALLPGSHESLMHVMTTGPFTLAPGESDTAAFAVLGADSLSEMKFTALRARNRYLSLVNKLHIPDRFTLAQNYPNPFNSSTIIEFDLPQAADLSVEVFNILGQRVRVLLHGEQLAGHHRVLWDGKNGSGKPVASGIYFYRIQADGLEQSRKMLLLK